MIPIDEYADAIRGRTPEMAFVVLESRYREVVTQKIENSDNIAYYNAAVIEYMNHSVAAARALGIELLDDWQVPSHKASGSLGDRFSDFTTAVDHFKVQVQISNARLRNTYSVALDISEKEKIRHFVNQIKELIDKSSLATPKKEQLYDKINAFLKEVDRDRTAWDTFSDLAIGVAHLGGEMAKELEPARKLIDSISRLLGKAKEIEDSVPRLPSERRHKIPGPPKQIEPPREGRDDMDDEIPF